MIILKTYPDIKDNKTDVSQVLYFELPIFTMVFAVSTTATEVDAPKVLTVREAYQPPSATTSNGRIVPIKHENNADFGAEIYGVDLNNFTSADFALISDALHHHKLLVFKEQPQMLTPQQQYRLTAWYLTHKSSYVLHHITDTPTPSSFDPDEKTGGFAHGADPVLLSEKGVTIYGLPNRPAINAQPQVHILGRGEVPEDHFDFPPGFKVKGINHVDFHLPPHIPQEERDAGSSRFYQWHWDGSLYKIPPPRVGCLLAVRTPKGPDVTVHWGDGTGRTMNIAPGATAMVAGSRALQLLDPELREIVLHSRIEYAPHAFQWMSTARSTKLGHLIETEGREMPLDKLSPWTEEGICVYPMVWTNPVTGEKSLQVHGQGAFKLYLKNQPDGEETIVTDLKEVRTFMDK